MGLAALAAVGACANPNAPKPPPTDEFYWPSGLVFVPGGATGPSDGTLFVVNANFDRRFDNGSLVGLNLSRVGGPDAGLPPFGAPVPDTGPRQITSLNINPATSMVPISSFGGVMAAANRDGGVRLFVPTRAEGHYVFAVDAILPQGESDQPQLFCVRPENFDGGTFKEKDCLNAGMTTMANLYTGNGLPRAPAPYAAAVSKDGKNAFVTHVQNADSPVNSTMNPVAYIVKIDVEHPQVTNDSFINVLTGGTDSIVAGRKWVYATGRYFVPIAYMLRMVDADGEFIDPGVENPVKSLEARGLALSSDESRVYIAGRSPDVLVVCSITGADTPFPLVKAMHTTQLPASPNQVVAIPRAGRSDLVVIASSDVGTVSFYDDDLGSLVGQIAGVGQQPFAIAVDPRDGKSARLYVSNFVDGRVAVIDVPDLTRPDQARLVAHLSGEQLCLTQGTAGGACDAGTVK